jgi:hypothetical protein
MNGWVCSSTIDVWLGLVMELVEELEWKILVGSGRWGASFGFGVRCLVLHGDGGDVWKIWRHGASCVVAVEKGIRVRAEFGGT